MKPLISLFLKLKSLQKKNDKDYKAGFYDSRVCHIKAYVRKVRRIFNLCIDP